MGYFGWTLCAVGVMALLALLITSGDIRDHTAGTGERRISRRSQLAAQRKRIAALEEQIAKCPTCTPEELGFPTVEEIAASDRSDPAPYMAAPAGVDIGVASAPLAAATTARDTTLAAMARPGEEGMLAALKATAQQPKPKASAEPRPKFSPDAVTAVFPVVPDRPATAVDDTVVLDIPAPTPEYAATAVPPGLPDLAHHKVHAALSEAS